MPNYIGLEIITAGRPQWPYGLQAIIRVASPNISPTRIAMDLAITEDLPVLSKQAFC